MARIESLPSPPQAFVDLSRRIGSDPMLVQGPGGNTSVKFGRSMWIKASGTRLSDAGHAEIFVPVDVDAALAKITADGNRLLAVPGFTGNLRPSIETTFHALLPHRYVFHYHSVQALCSLISQNGTAALSGRMAGLNWLLVEYVQPGIRLSRAISASFGKDIPNIVLLRNHGVVVAADRISEIAALVDEIENRLKLPRREFRVDAALRATVPGWERVSGTGFLAHDPESRDRVISGSFFPVQVVFLGPALPIVQKEPLLTRIPSDTPAALVRDNGAFLRSGCGREVREMVQCLADILARIPSGWKLHPLSDDEILELTDWDAEKHRQKMARERN